METVPKLDEEEGMKLTSSKRVEAFALCGAEGQVKYDWVVLVLWLIGRSV